MKRCLFVTDISVGSPYQGNKERTSEMLGYIQEMGYITDVLNVGFGFFGIRALKRRFRNISVLNSHGLNIVEFYLKGTFLSDFIRRKFFSKSFVTVDFFHKGLDLDINFSEYSLVWVNYAKNLKYLPNGLSARVFCDTHDACGLRINVESVSDDFLVMDPATEIRLLNMADVVIAIQPDEAFYFRGVLRKDVVVTTYMSQLPKVLCDNSNSGVLKVGYIGSDNPNNVKSILDFISVCDEAELSFELLIAGSVTRRIPKRNYIRNLGEVEEVRQFYNIVDCTINPMVGGSGLKIKTMESLRYNRLVFGLIDGFSGISTVVEKKFVCLDNVEIVSKLNHINEIEFRVADENKAHKYYERIVKMNTLNMEL